MCWGSDCLALGTLPSEQHGSTDIRLRAQIVGFSCALPLISAMLSTLSWSMNPVPPARTPDSLDLSELAIWELECCAQHGLPEKRFWQLSTDCGVRSLPDSQGQCAEHDG